MAKYFYSVPESSERIGVSRTTMYQLVKSGAIRSVRIGGALRIPAEAIDEFAQSVTSAA